MKRLIFMSAVPFTKQKIKDFSVDYFKKYFNVELWSFERILGIKIELPDQVKYIIINSYAEAENKLSKYSETVFLINGRVNYFGKKKIDLLKFDNIFLVSYRKSILQKYFARKYIYKNSKSIIYSLKSILKRSILFQIFFLNYEWRLSFKHILFSPNNYQKQKNIIYIKTHHPKYNEKLLNFKEYNLENRIPVKDYVLFIDSYLPHHPDFYLQNIKSIEPNNYFKLLNKYFEFIERENNCQVVVALDPKSNYMLNPFNDRLLYKGQTTNLIKNSRLVLAHSSTSILNAIIDFKPINLLVYSEMKITGAKRVYDLANSYSKELGIKLINLDNDFEYDLNISEIKYKKFLKKYIINYNRFKDSNTKIIKEFFDNF